MVDVDAFVGPWWRDRLYDMEAAWGDGLPADPLNDRAVLDAGMVVGVDDTRTEAQLSCMLGGNNRRADEIRRVLGTDPGHADVHHMHHLWAAGWPKPDAVGPIVEWGGGYGNLAVLSRRFDSPPRHVIVDLPTVARLQRHLLTGVAGVDVVDVGDWVASVEDGTSPTPDTFIANYSLDECAAACHDWVIDRDWFGACHVSIAMQIAGKADMFPDASRLWARLAASGFRSVPAHVSDCVYMRMDR